MTTGPGLRTGRDAPAPSPATAPTTSLPAPVLSRRRSWLVLAALALLTAVYLTGWSAWATLHVTERYEQRAPGAPASRGGAEFRVVSLTQSSELADSTGGEPQAADPGAVFVVAVVEAIPRVAAPSTLCTVALLGPDGRTWEPGTVRVQRRVPYCSAADARPGQPYRFESVFLVPERYAGALRGVVLTETGGAGRSAVLRPPG